MSRIPLSSSFLPLVGLLLLGACGDKGEDAPEDLSACSAADAPGPEVWVGPLSLDGDSLTVEVSYGGGCEEHQLAICWPEQALLEEEPPQALLEVWHDGNGDNCEAEITEELVVDLSPLREAHGEESGTIQVTVDTETIEYSF